MSEVALLSDLLEESYRKKAWQGPNLRGALRGVHAAQAAWRPGPRRHGIWDLTLHAAYWKYAVWRMLAGEKRGAFPRKGSNWFLLPSSPTEKAWREDLGLLDEQHRKLRKAVEALSASTLRRRPRGSKYSTAALVYGVASHDVYHTGQIQLLKRLWSDRAKS